MAAGTLWPLPSDKAEWAARRAAAICAEIEGFVFDTVSVTGSRASRTLLGLPAPGSSSTSSSAVPPTQYSDLEESIQKYLLTLSALMPLYEVDTTAGSYSEAPPAGLNNATGQSNQSMEITYIKTSAGWERIHAYRRGRRAVHIDGSVSNAEDQIERDFLVQDSMTDEQKILETILRETGKIVDSETAFDSLNLESLEFLDLVLQIETALAIKFSDLAIVRMNKVGDVLVEADAARLIQG